MIITLKLRKSLKQTKKLITKITKNANKYSWYYKKCLDL